MCMRMLLLLLLLLLQLVLRSESYHSASTGFSRISSSSSSSSSLLFHTRRSIRIMALNIEEQSSPTDAYSNSAQLKSHIFSLAATVDRGFGAKQQEREEILALIDKLKTMNPFPIPTYGLYDGNYLSLCIPTCINTCLPTWTYLHGPIYLHAYTHRRVITLTYVRLIQAKTIHFLIWRMDAI